MVAYHEILLNNVNPNPHISFSKTEWKTVVIRILSSIKTRPFLIMSAALALVNDWIFQLELEVESSANSKSVSAITSSNSAAAAVAPAPAASTVKEGNATDTDADTAAKKEKKPKIKKEKAPAAPVAPPATEEINLNSLDLRVGVIVKVKKHDTADKLYCEEIDIGEAEPRQIASGLVPHYTLEEMEGRRLIVIANLKPRNLVGFKSCGMVLCAALAQEDGSEKVEFLDPPIDAPLGSRVVVYEEGMTELIHVPSPLTASQCDKRKAFEKVAAELRTDEEGVGVFRGKKLMCDGKVCTAPTLRGALLR